MPELEKIENQGSGVETPHTIFEMFSNVDTKRYVLPSIQRKFVWKEIDIIKLFDSLMLGYPIGSFLISPQGINRSLTVKFYQCLRKRNYNKSVENNDILEPATHPDSWLILDGQQRLTSINIGLNGEIIRNTQKIVRRLYFNHKVEPKLNTSSFNKESYEFKFLTEKEADQCEWFLVNKILSYKDKKDQLLDGLNNIEKSNLERLYHIIFENKNLHIYKMSETCSLYDILAVFNRLNSTGAELSNPNLIFSVLVSYRNELRAEIDGLLNIINNYGFSFTEEYVIKFALVAIGLTSSLKLKNFSKKDSDNIGTNWKAIKQSIIETMKLLSDEYYMTADHISSENAVIPINYLIYLRLSAKQKIGEQFNPLGYKALLKIDKNDKSKGEIYELRKFLVLAQTIKLFSSGSDKIVDSLCKFIKNNESKKPKEKQEISLEFFQGWSYGDKNIKVDDEYIKSLFEFKKGSEKTFLILSLLYPEEKFNSNSKHQDHLHPESEFKGKKLIQNFNGKDLKFYRKEYNLLANLHFLEALENETKNNLGLDKWLAQSYLNMKSVKCLPFTTDDDVKKGDFSKYKLENFENFIKARKIEMEKEFKKIFNL